MKLNIKPTDISAFKRIYRKRNEGESPEEMIVNLKKVSDLKYGENPNQQAAIYAQVPELLNLFSLVNLRYVRTDDEGKGGLSLTNTMDISRALDVLKYFNNKPAVVIMKHNIVSGFAKGKKSNSSLANLFRTARDCDKRSNFGGAAVFNQPLDKVAAQSLFELKKQGDPFFVDVLAAPDYEEGVLDYIQRNHRTVRIASFDDLSVIPRFQGDNTYGLKSFKEMPGGLIGVQDLYLPSIKSAKDLILRPKVIKKGKEYVIKNIPSSNQIDDLMTAWYLNVAGARSNGIVFVKDRALVSMGSGQVERVGAVEQAIIKGMQKAMDREGIEYNPLFGIRGYLDLKINPFKGAACSSDAFFPFSDSIKLLAEIGVTSVVQPYGSVRDYLVIEEANEKGIAMPATLERCFGHF